MPRCQCHYVEGVTAPHRVHIPSVSTGFVIVGTGPSRRVFDSFCSEWAYAEFDDLPCCEKHFAMLLADYRDHLVDMGLL